MAEVSKSTEFAAPGGLPPLLAADEPAPFEVYNETGAAPVLLVCDHANRFIPRALGKLGLSEVELCRHIAWDIGIADVTRGLARRLDATAVLSHFSRLVVDPNRALADESLVPAVSDGVTVPRNQAVPPEARKARIAAFHAPYHAAVEQALTTSMGRPTSEANPAPALVSMHSFTPVMDGIERPWQIGILWDHDGRLPVPMMEALRARGIAVGDNQPYSGHDVQGYTLRRHAEAHGLPNVLIEVRQDLIDTHHGAAEWVEVLGEALVKVLAGLGLRDGIPKP
jgi:predicted N-formylglutamate amidohydrolase